MHGSPLLFFLVLGSGSLAAQATQAEARWGARIIQEIPFLLRPSEAGFADNINVMLLSSPPDTDAPEPLAVYKERLGKAPGSRLHTGDVREVNGRRVAYLPHGAPMGERPLVDRALLDLEIEE